MATRSGRRSKQAATDEPELAVPDERAAAVDEAVQARLDDDTPQGTGEDEDEAVTEAPGGAVAVDRAFEGTDFELSEEQLAEMLGENEADDDATGLLGRIGREDVQKGTPGEDLLGGGDDSSEPKAPFSDRPAAFEAGPDVREAGVFDLLDQPGAADSDPLSSFLGAVEAKLGRDLGLTTPADAAEDEPTFGKEQIAGGATHRTEVIKNPDGSTSDTLHITENLNAGIVILHSEARGTTDVFDANNGTQTTLNPDGSTTTKQSGSQGAGQTTPALTGPNSETVLVETATGTVKYVEGQGIVVDETQAAKDAAKREAERKKQEEAERKRKEEEERKKQEEQRKKEEEKKKEDGEGASTESTPGDDDEFVLPEELSVDGDIARLRELRNQGPDSGDGATDPSEIESEVVGAAGDLPTHAELGESLFGQPDTSLEVGGGGGTRNEGANSRGAGVITPQDDQQVSVGPRRNDDPFDAAPAPKPIAESDDADDADDDEGATSFLPPSEIDSRVDTPGDDLPDAIDLSN